MINNATCGYTYDPILIALLITSLANGVSWFFVRWKQRKNEEIMASLLDGLDLYKRKMEEDYDIKIPTKYRAD